MKKILVLILFVILPVSYAFSQESYDLNKTVRTAINNSLTVSAYQNNISIQELNLKSAYGNLIPSLSFSGNWTRNNTYNKGGTTYLNGVPLDYNPYTSAANSFSLGLNSSVTLFNGFANYENIDLQKESIAQLKTTLEQAKYDIVIGVYQRFFDVLKKEKIQKTNEDNLAVSKDQLDKIKEYVNVGKKTMSDVYKQDVQVAQNELSVVSSASDVSKAKVEMLNYLNEDVAKEIALDATGIFIPEQTSELKTAMARYSNFESLVKNALDTRFDYKAAVRDITVNEYRLGIAKKNLYYPTLSAFGSYNFSSNDINNLDNSKILTFGLTLSYPIFQGFQTDVTMQTYEVNVKQKKEDLIKLERQIRSDLKKALYDLETSYKQIEITDRNIISAEQDKLLSEENFRIGYGTLLDVQVATTNLNNLKINRINFLYNFLLTQKQIDYLSGILKY
ncbi:MAG: TolC family protein [Bacteroidetes bacterium]|nr:TolC family protein [Bacteroidota bacterium]